MVEFLSLSNKSFGLEITDVSVRLMELSRRGGKIIAAVVGCAEIKEGIIKAGDIKNEEKLVLAIKEAVAKAVGAKISVKRVIMSLPENKAFSQVIKMPKLNDGDLRAAVIFEAENYIPLPLEKVYLDFEKVAPVLPDPKSDTQEVFIVAFPREAIDARIRAVAAAGLVPVAMELESQAVLRGLSMGCVLESPSIIIQIGDTKTNLIVYSGNSIRFTFSIPISNRYFLETIAASAKVDMDVAAFLKLRYGIEEFSSFPQGGTIGDPSNDGNRRKIFEALVPGLVDFVQQIQKCIQYYQSHDNTQGAGKGMFKKILICGSGSNLKGLDGFISLKLNFPVERVSLPIDVGAIEAKINGILPQKDLSGFSVVTGLAMRSLVEAKNNAKNNSAIMAVPAPTNVRRRRMLVRQK